MGLADILEKFEKVKEWLAGPGADALDKVVLALQNVTDAAEGVRDYLKSLGEDFVFSSLSEQDVVTVGKLEKVREEIASKTSGETVVGKALPPILVDLIGQISVELISKLLERWKKK